MRNGTIKKFLEPAAVLEHLLDDTLEYFECSYAEHEQQARPGFTPLNLRDDMQSRQDNLTTLAPPGQENCLINHVGDTKLIINGEDREREREALQHLRDLATHFYWQRIIRQPKPASRRC